MTPDDVDAWLLETDPSLRWQVERDLTGAAPEVWQATRARVPHEGVAAQLLSHQDADGQWAGGAYFPADASRDEPGQPWTATTWTLKILREAGVEPDALRPSTAELLRQNSRWEYDELPYWDGEVDVCINAFTLASGAWLGADVSPIRRFFLEHQLGDGGWNCEWVEGATVSSFPSTLNAIEGILDYERRVGGDAELRAARHRGEEYLLRRSLLRRLSSGEVHPWAVQFVYPFRWTYTALRATDHFRRAAEWDAASPDARLAEAVGVVRGARNPDGTWHQRGVHEGHTWIAEDAPPGEPSPWLTLHALRVLRWWDAAQAQPDAAAD
ncbi:squalene cyclase [Microbacterium sp. NPDC091313]